MKHIKRSAICILVLSAITAGAGEPLFENSDFEKGSLENWTAEGDAFTVQPTKGDNTAARGSGTSQHQGNYWIGTYEKYDGKEGKPGATRSDTPTGKLTSVEFLITKRYITFRIGAGNLPGKVGAKLLCEGKDYDMGSGVNSESMELRSFDAGKLVGKKARIVVFDEEVGGWGHINVDEFLATDEPAPEPSYDFKLAPGISASGYPDTGYDQPLRPQFHFSSKKNWLNDPNGMIFDGAKYHLFFQHNPLGTGWGNMTWGHATSTDMLHWKQHDHALLPYEVDRRKGTVFSGTAVVDHNNSLGEQVGDQKTLVAFYTYSNNQPSYYQAMAYSTDAGDTWTYHNEGRAVVDNQGLDTGERDPKVFWHEESKRWVMALWVERKPGRVRFFTSVNLKDWEFASDLMRDWAYECMDAFYAPLDGDDSNKKFVLYDASFDYEYGSFDGKEFKSESGHLKQGRGNFYAPQTFYNMPDGRAVQIGWMNGGPNSAQAYGLPFNQQMSFPYELTLRTTGAGVRLFCWPIKEIEALYTGSHEMKDRALGADNLIADLPKLDLVDLEIEFEPGTASEIVIDIAGVSLRYDVKKGVLTHNGVNKDGKMHRVTTIDQVAPRDGRVRLRLLIDRLSVEAFAFDGEKFGAHYIQPKHRPEKQSIHAVGGDAKVRSLVIRQLASAWK